MLRLEFFLQEIPQKEKKYKITKNIYKNIKKNKGECTGRENEVYFLEQRKEFENYRLSSSDIKLRFLFSLLLYFLFPPQISNFSFIEILNNVVFFLESLLP